MKVLFVTPRYAPAVGGVEWHSQMLTHELVAKGVRVEVACTDPAASRPYAGLVDGVLVRRFPTVRRDSTFLVSPSLALWLGRHARHYDVVHAHSYHTPLPVLAAIATRRPRVPLVITPHFHGTGHTVVRRLLHVPYRLAGAWAIRTADAVICVSDAERRLLRDRLGRRADTVTVLPNAIDPEEVLSVQPLAVPPSRRVVLVVGRLERYKGAERVIRAARLLPDDVGVVVIGDGPEREVVLASATRVGIAERFYWYPRVEREKLLAWYRTADVLVTMSEQEAFGITLLEAVVAGARVVASDIPAHREVARYLPAGSVAFVDPQASDAELSAAVMHAAARERVAGADETVPRWLDVAAQTLEVYQKVASPSR